MKSTMRTRIVSILLSFVMLIGLLPLSVFAYWEEPTAEGNAELETTVYDYTQPVGVTMQRLTGNCVTENGNLGDDLLFVIKSGDRYYAMKDVAASEEAYDAIPAVDVTAWVNADGSLTVPADTLDVAFWRYEQRPEYEYGMFINGRENYIAYSYGYESTDGDDDYYNDAERNYWGKFKICTFEDGGYIESDPYYWSENGTSGTLKFNGSWSYKISSYNYLSLKYNVIADLRSDGSNGQEFYFRYLGTDVEYVGDEVEGYIYYADCRHQHIVRHAEYDAPTCMLKGCEEYWYCEGCNKYFKDEAMTQLWGESMPIIPATGHDWDGETCANCDRPVPVYSKVTNQADFNALADDTMFILVSEYGGKYYAPDLGELYLYMMDSDGDGYRDIHDIDENGNDIPDYFEVDDGGEEGVYDYLEWDMDDDGDVDADDHLAFSEMICDQYLTDRLYSNNGIGAVEVTMNSDGTFSHEAAKATAEFEMVDLYLKEEIDDMIGFVKESEDWWTDDMRYTYECVKQFVIPNMFITAPSMAPVERQYRQRIAEHGDTYSWGVLFYNNASDYKVYNYETGSVEQAKLNDVCTQDSVVVFDTFDHMWYDATWNRQLGQLRLRDYNGAITFVTGEDYMLEGSEWIYDESTESGYYETHDTQAAVYLYASQQPSHICEFKNWKDNEDGRTHTGTCECGETETKTHNWDNGVETEAPTCTEKGVKTYTCDDCGATKTEDVDALDHDWSDWEDDGADAATDTHTRSCQREDCNETEQLTHNWSRWTPDGDTHHTKTCPVCSGTRTDTHKWDEGVITTQPTEDEKGVKTYTCSECGHTKTEPVDKLEHVHNWSNWGQNDENTHIRSCRCNETETATHNFDDGVVINWATHIAPGEIHFTCADCGYVRIDTQPALEEHEWSDWVGNKDGTHTRSCICNETETKDCTYDSGVVTEQPTHYEEGVKTYTCSVCSDTKTEAVSKTTEHEWSDWTGNNDGRTHTRECKCGETETAAHNWSTWAEQDDGSFQRQCGDCGAFESMTLDEEKPVNTTANDNAANTNLTNMDIELIENVLTDEEQSQVAEGAEVKVYLKVEDISEEAPTEHREEAEAKAGDDEIGMYLDIDLFKQVGNATETPVTETAGAVSITITIPENLINTDASVTRTYKIIRVHEDDSGNLITDVIEGVFNPEDNTFTFETDKFSTYALVYADETQRPDVILGDVDLNGNVEAADALMALQAATGKVNLSAEQQTRADVDGTAGVTANDALLILQYATKKIAVFPAEA